MGPPMSMHPFSGLPGHEQSRRLMRALAMLGLVVLGGTLGFMRIEGWGVWRSFYLTLVTITTVGFSDEGLSPEGKQFCALLIVGGITSASYTFALTVQKAMASQQAWRKRMQKSIGKLSEHTIVCGFGRMGRSLCRELSRKEMPFVVIENDEEVYNMACELGYMAIRGNATEDRILSSAGMQTARSIVCLVPHEPDAIVVTMGAREESAEMLIISRAESKEGVRKLRQAGAQRVISPYQAGGVEILDALAGPNDADVILRTQLQGKAVILAEVLVEENSALIGKTLQAYGKREGTGISFVAFRRKGEDAQLQPAPTTRLQLGDHLMVAGDPAQIRRMQSLAASRGRRRAA